MSSERWRSRLVGAGTPKAEDILEHPRNARDHTLVKRRVLAGVIDDIGFVEEVIISKGTGRLVNGHLRRELAREAGIEELPVHHVDLAKEEEALVLASSDAEQEFGREVLRLAVGASFPAWSRRRSRGRRHRPDE